MEEQEATVKHPRKRYKLQAAITKVKKVDSGFEQIIHRVFTLLLGWSIE